MFLLAAPGGYDIELESALASGHVGSPVLPADRALLRLRPLRHYSAGELVAIKRRTAAAELSSSSSTAAAVMQLTGDAATGSDAADAGHQLCYARVAVDAAPAAGQAAYRLSVEVQPGVYETMLSTQVKSCIGLCDYLLHTEYSFAWPLRQVLNGADDYDWLQAGAARLLWHNITTSVATQLTSI